MIHIYPIYFCFPEEKQHISIEIKFILVKSFNIKKVNVHLLLIFVSSVILPTSKNFSRVLLVLYVIVNGAYQ